MRASHVLLSAPLAAAALACTRPATPQSMGSFGQLDDCERVRRVERAPRANRLSISCPRSTSRDGTGCRWQQREVPSEHGRATARACAWWGGGLFLRLWLI